MARLPRLAVTDAAHLVVWRGHNGQPVFVDDDDRQAWLAFMAESAAREGVEWHGHALLVSALWMLATPRREGALSRWMQALGRTYVRRFNQRHGRRGTLWDGRYRAAVLAPDWVLPALVFLDQAPVWEGLAAAPEAWPWSSHRHYVGAEPQRAVTPPAAWWSLGDTPFAREAAYRRLVQEGLSQQQVQRLREAALKGWPLGDAAFLAALQAQTGRRTEPARPGRPRKATSDLSPNNSQKSLGSFKS
jgi:putative transposase